jgi:hypothetical protein
LFIHRVRIVVFLPLFYYVRIRLNFWSDIE